MEMLHTQWMCWPMHGTGVSRMGWKRGLLGLLVTYPQSSLRFSWSNRTTTGWFTNVCRFPLPRSLQHRLLTMTKNLLESSCYYTRRSICVGVLQLWCSGLIPCSLHRCIIQPKQRGTAPVVTCKLCSLHHTPWVHAAGYTTECRCLQRRPDLHLSGPLATVDPAKEV